MNKVSWLRAHPAEQLQPVHAGHLHIRDDEIVETLGGQPESGGAVVGGIDRVALPAQRLLDARAQASLVVDHQNADFALIHGKPPSARAASAS